MSPLHCHGQLWSDDSHFQNSLTASQKSTGKPKGTDMMLLATFPLTKSVLGGVSQWGTLEGKFTSYFGKSLSPVHRLPDLLCLHCINYLHIPSLPPPIGSSHLPAIWKGKIEGGREENFEHSLSASYKHSQWGSQ